jgi:DnaJ-class molecular chaperone
MSEEEALEILGLDRGAHDEDINEAHRRLVQMVHPDRGGSHYLTVKINQARKVLLGATGRSRPVPAATPRKSARRRPQRREHP